MNRAKCTKVFLNNLQLFNYLIGILILVTISCKSPERVEPSRDMAFVESIDPRNTEIPPTELEGHTLKEVTLIPSAELAKPIESSFSYGVLEDRIVSTAVRSKSAYTSMTYEAASIGSELSLIKIPGDQTTEIKPGQLTAGEWNDLMKWDDWKELLVNTEYKNMQDHWQIFPHRRYAVFVHDQHNVPVNQANVSLIDAQGNTLWEAISDNYGKAELWQAMFTNHVEKAKLRIKVSKDQVTKLIEQVKTMPDGVNHVMITRECMLPMSMDIMFVVDGTGSMGDEIRYLQTELKDVISRISAERKEYEIRLGSVFYRDHGDEYLVRTEALTTEHKKVMTFISEQRADGGGDYPEAVDEALEEALDQDWNDNATARIIFLLLDAPPHEDEKTMKRIKNQVAEAAARGIKIVPITASGIDRATEFLMKFMAIATNGTYVFITNHSGIGGDHLEHIIPDYEVEKLNDILVRVILGYSLDASCSLAQTNIEEAVFDFYPNPASQSITLRAEHRIDRVEIFTNSGRRVLLRENIDPENYVLSILGLVDGAYQITIHSGQLRSTRTLIIVHNS